MDTHTIESCNELIIVFRLFENVDFVFLLLARDSSSELGSPLARASVLMILKTCGMSDQRSSECHASSHDIYQCLMFVSLALAFSTIDYC
jgi:hypothetical protein